MSDAPPTFGELVRQYRHHLDLTQAELARRVGCATITIRRIEAGTLRPSRQVAERLAAFLNVPEVEFEDFIRMARAAGRDDSPLPSPVPPVVLEEIGQEDLSGRAIRGYQLGEQLGRGGFGVVYKAVQPLIERDVALKIILPEFADHPNFIRRFEAEAQVVARLEHPHIVPLYDYWREPSVAYLIMRMMRGGSLKDLLNNGPISPELTLHFLTQIGQALQTAHRQGVVHRDIKPANILLDDEDNAYLADFGIAKDLHTNQQEAMTGEGAIIGSPSYISPEQISTGVVGTEADVYSLGIMVYEMLSGERPFKGPTPISLAIQHLNEPLPDLPENGHPATPHLNNILQRATEKSPKNRYSDVATFLTDLQAALANGSRPKVAADDFTMLDFSLADNPFRGLLPFTEADADSFFGRDMMVHELLSQLGEANEFGRFLAVVGPSGSGKSSLVKAGLIPALRGGGIPQSEKWFIVDMTPGTHPFESLETALFRVAVNPPETLLGLLQDGPRGILRTINRILPDDGETELLLLLDQFEELFTLVEDEEQREAFLDGLIAAILDPRSRLRVVATLRADFTDRPLQHTEFGELMRQRMTFVVPLSSEELEAAILKPLLQVGMTAEPQLVATMINDVSEQPGALPLMQYALTELFERRTSNTLTLQEYQASGGVMGALTRRADELYLGLEQEMQTAAHEIFLRLITLGEGAGDTRRRVLQSELQKLGDKQAIDAVIDQFGRYRLLTFDRDPVTRSPTVEVAHEALIRSWDRLREWLNESRDDLRLQRRLTRATAEWTDSKREVGFLYRGSQLDQVGHWVKEAPFALTADEQDFLQVSLSEQQRSARVRRYVTWGAVAAAVVMAVLAVAAVVFAQSSNTNAILAAEQEAEARGNLALAVTQQAEAEAERERADLERDAALAAQATTEAEAAIRATAEVEAEQRRLEAEQEREAAEEQREVAEEQRKEAEAQKNLAVSRELSLAALNSLEDDPELTMLLALEALKSSYTKEAAEALHNGVQTSRLLTRIPDHENRVWGAVFSPDDSLVATVIEDTTIEKRVRVWDAQSGELVQSMEFQGAFSLGTTLMFDELGEQLIMASISEDSESTFVTIWHLASGDMRTQVKFPITNNNFTQKLSPDWTMLAAGLEDGTTEIWDVETGDRLIVLSGHNLAISAIGISPDSSRLATASSDGLVNVWAIDSSLANGVGQLITSFETPEGFEPKKAYFSNDGSQLILGFTLNEFGLWHLEDKDHPLTLFSGHSNGTSEFAFHPDNPIVASSAGDGKVKVWDSITGTELFTLAGHKGFVNTIYFSTDGTKLLSAGSDSTVRIWNVEPSAGGELMTFGGGQPHLFLLDLELSPDEQLIAFGGRHGPAEIWHAETGEYLYTLAGEPDTSIYRVAFHPDGSRIATVGDDNLIRIWDVSTGDVLQSFSGHGEGFSGGVLFSGVLDVAYSPDGRQLATAGADGIAKVWSAETNELLLTLEGHTAGLHSLAYSPNGRYLATSSDSPERGIKVWDTQTGAEIYSFGPERGRAWGLAFDSESNLLAAAGSGGYIKVWDLNSGEEVANMLSQVNTITSLAFMPDGKRLVSGGVASVNIWDIATGSELLNIAPGGQASLSLTKDGQRLYTADSDGVIRVYVIPEAELISLAQSRVTRPLTEAECQQYLHAPSCP